MTRYRVVATSLAGLLLLAFGSHALHGYATYAKWLTLPVVVFINPSNADVSTSAAEAAVKVGMEAWNTQGGSPFQFLYGGRVSDTTTGYDQRNVVLFRNKSNGSAIATTYWWTMGGAVVDADVIFWDGGFTFVAGSATCPSGGVYIEDIATHELGHVLGLHHSNVSGATMYPSYSRCSKTLRTLESDDIAGIRSLYGTLTSLLNTAPTVSIAAPSDGATYEYGTSIQFSGSAQDQEDGSLTSKLKWTSNRDGAIGQGGGFTRVLSEGVHAITAKATDSGGLTGSRQVTVTVAAEAVAAKEPTSSGPTLWGRTYRVRSYYYAELTWTGFTSTKVDVYRNGTRLTATANDGLFKQKFTSAILGTTYVYKLCAKGTSYCTNDVTLKF